jgi:uncharacterized damage-inducible protein DinB
MNKFQLLENIQNARAAWETALAQLGEVQMLSPGASSEWSIKDVIAHLTWHDREMLSLMQTHVLAGSEMWGWPLNERNYAIYLANRDRPLPEVCQEAQQVFSDLLESLETLEEEDLHDPARFSGMPADWVPWELIAENTCEHYQDHLPEAQALLRG